MQGHQVSRWNPQSTTTYCSSAICVSEFELYEYVNASAYQLLKAFGSTQTSWASTNDQDIDLAYGCVSACSG
jgi:hypothetical protein